MAKRIQTVTFLKEFGEGDKGAPQAKAIVASVVEDHGLNTPVTVEDIIKSMEGNVTTRQPLARIFGYYAPKLEEAGFIEIVRSEGASKSAKEDDAAGVDGEMEDSAEDEVDSEMEEEEL